MTDRDDEIRRLAEALCTFNKTCEDCRKKAQRLIAEGWRRTAPPPEPEIVVSEEAMGAYRSGSGWVWIPRDGASDDYIRTRQANGLRAAFPLLLRDNPAYVAAHLPKAAQDAVIRARVGTLVGKGHTTSDWGNSVLCLLCVAD